MKRFVGATSVTAILVAVVLVWLTHRAPAIPSLKAHLPEAQDRRPPPPEPRWQRDPGREDVAPPIDVGDRRKALESELERLRAEGDERFMAFMRDARALKAYDPVLCAHMDNPLCPPYAMADAELDRLADCGGVKLDTPKFLWRDEPLFDPRWESVDLTPDERERLDTALAALQRDFEAASQKMWRTETGDEADAAALDVAGINFMLFTTNRPAGFDAALRYVSAEVAGRSPTGSPPPHVVDYLRTMVGAGDHIESTLAETLGATKAAQLRHAASGWGYTLVTSAGCPDEVERRARVRAIEAELGQLDHTD